MQHEKNAPHNQICLFATSYQSQVSQFWLKISISFGHLFPAWSTKSSEMLSMHSRLVAVDSKCLWL